jgi:hypothetical protein
VIRSVAAHHRDLLGAADRQVVFDGRTATKGVFRFFPNNHEVDVFLEVTTFDLVLDPVRESVLAFQTRMQVAGIDGVDGLATDSTRVA